MAKNIDPSLVKIGDYLKLDDDTVFTIPEYQRAYSWNIDNCDKLWQDILDYTESDNKDSYFFGTIIVNCQDNDTKYGLIDGQQRTTTFLLLLKALLLRINTAVITTSNDEDSVSLCRALKERRRRIMSILYKVDVEEIEDKPELVKDKNICGKADLIENYSINEQYKTELNTILKSVEYSEAESSAIKLPRKQKDNKYTNFFRNFKYFYRKCSELSESMVNKIAKSVVENCEVIEIKSWKVEQAITMFNSLNSDGMPLYDSDIISAKLYAVAEKQGKGDDFTSKWKELMTIVGELEDMRIADIDAILTQQMYYERAKDKNIVNSAGSIDVTVPGLRRYFTDINKNILNNPIELCEGMINLSKIWRKIAGYPTTQVLLKFNENTKLFLASYFYRFAESDITEEVTKPLLENFLKLFAILELVDTGYSSKYFKTFLFGEEVKLVDASITMDEITEDFNLHINACWDKKVLSDSIMDYDKHILVYLNEYLVAKEKEIPFSLSSSYDIEHIMPYSGNNVQTIRKDAGIESEEEFYSIVNKLGNKILLEQKINRSIGNEWFRTKVSTKLGDKTGYIDSNYPVAKELVEKYKNDSKPYWKKEDIKLATEKVSDRIIKFIFCE